MFRVTWAAAAETDAGRKASNTDADADDADAEPEEMEAGTLGLRNAGSEVNVDGGAAVTADVDAAAGKTADKSEATLAGKGRAAGRNGADCGNRVAMEACSREPTLCGCGGCGCCCG